ncbi:MAG: efflux RND transporter permease subunit, partial [Rikenellaceae bacterium]
TGTFYSQFGLTMAAAVGISTINALTLSPAICAILLKPTHDESGSTKNNFTARFREGFNATFDVMTRRYAGGVIFIARRKFLPWILLLLACATLVFLMSTTPTGLVPDEDQGTLFVSVNTSPGNSLHTTEQIMEQVEQRLLDIPEIENAGRITGYSLFSGQGSSYGLFVVDLLDWELRTEKGTDVNSVIEKIYAKTADIKGASIFSMSPGMIPGYGTGNALEMHLQDRAGGDITALFNTTQDYLKQINARNEIAMAYTSFDIRFPQWLVEVDAAKAIRAGIAPSEVLSVLSGYYSSQYVSDINLYTKVYQVNLEAAADKRLDEESLKSTFVRMSSGEMAPLSQFVTLTKVYGAESLNRFNMYNSIQLNIMPADGYSSGDVIAALKEVAATALPVGYGYDFGGMTREESETNSSATAMVFAICFLMIYLILSALYESYIVPLAVILAVPFGLMGSFIFAKIFGLDNNIYLQTGLIMLIGLLSKTAILITEYASERRRAGMTITAAAISAAKARFRAILMTALSMIFGLMPLMMATGVGANGNRSLASGTVGGMIIGTFSLMFVVPVMFIAFQWIQEKIAPARDFDEE